MTQLQDIFLNATSKTREALRFYEQNYSSIGQWILMPGSKVVLPSTKSGTCRFCGLSTPKVTFHNEAHAIPECLGNRSLFTKYECDDCNRLFGLGIENDFGNWSKAQRALSGIRGKKGVPTLKEESNRQWRLEHGSAGITVTQDDGDPIAVVNEGAKEITVTVRRDPYTPVAVLKAFVKMALSLLPEEELPNFQSAMSWVRNTNHQVGFVKTDSFPVCYTFVPGKDPFENIAVILLRRRADNLPVPYVTFVLRCGNEAFQIIIPCPERDAAISDRKVKFSYFPTPCELDQDIKLVAPVQRELIDLTGRSRVNGNAIQTVLRYDFQQLL